MGLFKNYSFTVITSVLLILGISIYLPKIRKYIHEGFQNEKDGCSLDCTNKDIMAAVKKEFESRYVEGFTSGPQNELQEAFQDPSQLLSLVKAASGNPQLSGLLGNLPTGLPGVSSTGQPDLAALTKLMNVTSIPGIQPVEEPKYKISRNKLKTIRRAIKVDDNKCEYHVMYDESNMNVDGSMKTNVDTFGYIQVKFVKQGETGCYYTPKEVKLLVGPEILRRDAANPESPVPELNYVF